MKPICYPILGIVVLLAVSSCIGGENQNEVEPSSTYVPKYDRLVRSNIERIKTDSWDKNNYLEIRDNQIPKMKGRKKQSESLMLLKLNACLSMEKELKGLMESKCTKDNYKNNHKRMDAIYAELTGKEFKDVVTGDSHHVRTDYNTHQRLIAQVGKQYAPVKVTSFKDRYDLNYDKTVTNDSKTMYNNNRLIADRCHYLKNGLNNVSFQGRHMKYCEAVVANYETVASWSEADENVVLSRISTFESEFRNKPEWRKWNDRISAVKVKFAQE